MNDSFSKKYSLICEKGYLVLGRALPIDENFGNPWLYRAGNPPSYSAFGRYRFLRTLELARQLNASTVLDVAGEEGFFAACLYEEGQKIYVNDIRPSQKGLKKWTTGSFLTFIEGNFFDLDPHQTGVFDLVIACEVIEHIAEREKFIAHLKRFIASGGTLLLTTSNGEYFRSKLPTYAQVSDFEVLQKFGFDDIQIELSITPWLSGHCAFRVLPSHRLLTPFYVLLDAWTKSLGVQASSRLCTQLFVIAKVP